MSITGALFKMYGDLRPTAYSLLKANLFLSKEEKAEWEELIVAMREDQLKVFIEILKNCMARLQVESSA